MGEAPTLQEDFELGGRFWLRQAPKQTFGGTPRYSGGRVTLRLLGARERPHRSQAAGRARASTNSAVMVDETRFEQRLDRVLAHASSPRGAGVVIATVSTLITVGAGILMTVADRDNFPSIGSGLWWAVQTVTTVGYGDHVPATVAGRLVASLVMLVGIGFLTVITAAITSTFVSRSRREQALIGVPTSTPELRQIAERLERIEAALTDRPSG